MKKYSPPQIEDYRQTKSKFSIYIYLYQNPMKDGVAFSGFAITFFYVVSVEFGKVC